MSRGPDASTRLTRAIETDARAANCAAVIACADWSRWSSATFSGARHDITLRAVASDGLDHWIARLPDAELSGRGMLVADLTVTGVRREGEDVMILIEALTVES